MAPKSSAKRTASSSPTTKGKRSAPARSTAVASSAQKTALKPQGSVVSLTADDKGSAPRGLLLLQSVARGYLCRLGLGDAHKQHLRAVLSGRATMRETAFGAFERRQRMQQQRSDITKKEKLEARMKLQSALSLAAFEGNDSDLRRLLKEGANPLRPDAEGNYAIGEAAVNGQVEAIRLLLAAGADPNAKGVYGRTPLWRAAYNSHEAAIQVLLEAGGDPRISSQAQLPLELASGSAKTKLTTWNVSRTEELVKTYEAKRSELEAAERRAQDLEKAEQRSKLADAKIKLHAAQQAARAALAKMEQCISHYDVCAAEGAAERSRQALLDAIKDAERDAHAAESFMIDASDAYLAARRAASCAASSEGDGEPSLTDELLRIIPLGRLEVGNLVQPGWAAKAAAKTTRQSGDHVALFPLLVDITAISSTFYRYRNVNFIDSFSPNDLSPHRIRSALLGSLRYGKGLVVDLRDVPMLDFVTAAFERVAPGLWAQVVSGAVMNESVYMTLVKPDDGPEYERDQWRTSITANFVLLLLTSGFVIDDELANQFLLFRLSLDE